MAEGQGAIVNHVTAADTLMVGRCSASGRLPFHETMRLLRFSDSVQCAGLLRVI